MSAKTQWTILIDLVNQKLKSTKSLLLKRQLLKIREYLEVEDIIDFAKKLKIKE